MKTLKALRSGLNDIKEANFEFVDRNKKSRDVVIKLAKKHGLKVKERKKGNLSNLDLEGPNNKMGKFMEQLPQDALEGVNEGMNMRQIMQKHGRELKKAQRTGNLDISQRAEEDLFNWTLENGEVMTDDPDEFIEWLDNNLDDIIKGRIK